MFAGLIAVFVLGYTAIALEHPIRLNKAASALFTAVICWTIFMFGADQLADASSSSHWVESELMEHLGEISGILFFLLGAMTIVELVDAHEGFSLVTDKITTLSKSRLLIILSLVTFFMSAILDNLTTSIVMATLLRKLIRSKEDLWVFAGMMIISANAGGAWSPIGDVTTIMLWVGGQISALNIVLKLLLPSLICMLIPLVLLSRKMKGNLERPENENIHFQGASLSIRERRLVLILGIASLLFVPIFKSITHLPPFLGILFGLSFMWGLTEYLHRHKIDEVKRPLSISGVIQRIDTPSILFFLGILLSVAALQSAGILSLLASFLDHWVGNLWLINIFIGFLSSVVDNVPLVAGAMGMYSMNTYPTDHLFWELLAYCAGTGGSCLIIGSAAGVAMMSILNIDFIWYLRKMSLPAIAGYIGGVITFYAMMSALGT